MLAHRYVYVKREQVEALSSKLLVELYPSARWAGTEAYRDKSAKTFFYVYRLTFRHPK
jgi:hypothetical protein